MNLSAETLYSLFNNAPNLIIILNHEGTIQALNRPLGAVTIEASLGHLLNEFIVPLHHESLAKLLERVFQTGTSESLEVETTITQDKSSWQLINVGPITDNGNVVALSLFFTDIGEKKKALRALEKSELQLKSLIQNIPGMVYRGNANWEIKFIKGCEELCGFSPSEINSMEGGWLGVIYPDDRIDSLNEASVLREKPVAISQSYRIMTKSGNIRWVEDYKVSLFNQEGQFMGVDGITFDITERRSTEVELKRAKDKLIEQQARALLELSTPVIEIWDEVLVCPLIGTIDTSRAQQVLESLLDTIVARQSTVVILDITGVPVIDTQVANHLMLTVSAAGLIGADVILTGVSPHNASTLAKLGVDLKRVTTKGSLQQGLKVALKLTGKKIVSCAQIGAEA